MNGAWLAGGAAIAAAAMFAHNPTLRHIQRRIIQARAFCMAAQYAWREAWERGKAIYPEMERRAKSDA